MDSTSAQRPLGERTPEQRALDKEKRDKYEKGIQEKIRELHAIKERLYSLRYDYSRPESDIIRDVKNLSAEMHRIDEDINIQRKKELANFEKSLELQKIGLDPLITKSKSKTLLNASSDRESTGSASTSNTATKDGNAGFHHVAITTHEPEVEEHETMNEEEINANEKLMRTQSTQSMSNLSAQQKWQGLFKMFKEWKYQTNVGQASRIVSGNDQTGSVQEEIIKLRSAIYAMRQRKNLSKTDEDLLDQMNVRLRGLTKIAAELHETGRRKSVNQNIMDSRRSTISN